MPTRPISADRVFRRLPQPLKTLAASAHGARLARRRYGGVGRVDATERLVDEALERERWDASTWQHWLDERRDSMLRHAASGVPHYRSHWKGKPSSTDLADWPILEKDAVRRAPESFIAECSPKLYPETTSGTTGTPLRLVRSAAVEREWYALFEARSRRWYGVDRFTPWAILGGRLVVPPERTEPPFWVWNAGLNQLYLSSYHLRPDWVAHALGEMACRGVRHVYGYPSAVHQLARAAIDAGGSATEAARRVGLKVVVTNAEPLLDVQRRDIEAAFGCPVRETWGMAELVAAAGECEHGKMHLWPEVGVVEVDDDQEVIATTLIARDQPLIRYRLGDRLAETPPAPGDTSCPCGRTLPVIAGLEGRVDDALVLADGRRIGRLDPVFKGDLPIREAQIVQDTPTRVRLSFVPADGFDDSSRLELRQRLADRLGGGQDQDQLEIVLDAVERIPRDANGKFRAVVRAFDLDQEHGS